MDNQPKDSIYKLKDATPYFALSSIDTDEAVGIESIIKIQFDNLTKNNKLDEDYDKLIETHNIYSVLPRVNLVLTAELVLDTNESIFEQTTTTSNTNVSKPPVPKPQQVSGTGEITTLLDSIMEHEDNEKKNTSLNQKQQTEEESLLSISNTSDTLIDEDNDYSGYMSPPKAKKRKIKEPHEEIQQKIVNKIINTVLSPTNDLYCSNELLKRLFSSIFESSSFEPENSNGKSISFWKRKCDWANRMIIPSISTDIEKKTGNIIITLEKLPPEIAATILLTFILDYDGMLDWLTKNRYREKLPPFSFFSKDRKKKISFISSALRGNKKSLLYLQLNDQGQTSKYKLSIDPKYVDMISVPWIMYIIRSQMATAFGQLETILTPKQKECPPSPTTQLADVATDDNDVTEHAISDYDKWRYRLQFPTLPVDWDMWADWYKDRLPTSILNKNADENYQYNSSNSNNTNNDEFIKRRLLSHVGKRICWIGYLLETSRIYSIHSSTPNIYSSIEINENNNKSEILFSDDNHHPIQKRIIRSACQDGDYNCDILEDDIIYESRSIAIDSILKSDVYINNNDYNRIDEWASNAHKIQCIDKNINNVLVYNPIECKSRFVSFDPLATNHSYKKGREAGLTKNTLSDQKYKKQLEKDKQDKLKILNRVTSVSAKEIEAALMNSDNNGEDFNSSISTGKKYKMDILTYFSKNRPSM